MSPLPRTAPLPSVPPADSASQAELRKRYADELRNLLSDVHFAIHAKGRDRLKLHGWFARQAIESLDRAMQIGGLLLTTDPHLAAYEPEVRPCPLSHDESGAWLSRLAIERESAATRYQELADLAEEEGQFPLETMARALASDIAKEARELRMMVMRVVNLNASPTR